MNWPTWTYRTGFLIKFENLFIFTQAIDRGNRWKTFEDFISISHTMFAIFETFINIYNSNPSFPYSIDLVYLHSAYILYDQTKIQELLGWIRTLTYFNFHTIFLFWKLLLFLQSFHNIQGHFLLDKLYWKTGAKTKLKIFQC